MQDLMVETALRRPLRVLVAGNRFNLYGITYALAAKTGRYAEILENNIFLSRAETAYQVTALLKEAKTDGMLTLVTDLLTSFYDESVPEGEVDQLLFEAITELQRLGKAAPVVVSAHAKAGRPRLLKALERAAQRVEYIRQAVPYRPPADF